MRKAQVQRVATALQQLWEWCDANSVRQPLKIVEWDTATIKLQLNGFSLELEGDEAGQKVFAALKATCLQGAIHQRTGGGSAGNYEEYAFTWAADERIIGLLAAPAPAHTYSFVKREPEPNPVVKESRVKQLDIVTALVPTVTYVKTTVLKVNKEDNIWSETSTDRQPTEIGHFTDPATGQFWLGIRYKFGHTRPYLLETANKWLLLIKPAASGGGAGEDEDEGEKVYFGYKLEDLLRNMSNEPSTNHDDNPDKSNSAARGFTSPSRIATVAKYFQVEAAVKEWAAKKLTGSDGLIAKTAIKPWHISAWKHQADNLLLHLSNKNRPGISQLRELLNWDDAFIQYHLERVTTFKKVRVVRVLEEYRINAKVLARPLLEQKTRAELVKLAAQFVIAINKSALKSEILVKLVDSQNVAEEVIDLTQRLAEWNQEQHSGQFVVWTPEAGNPSPEIELAEEATIQAAETDVELEEEGDNYAVTFFGN